MPKKIQLDLLKEDEAWTLFQTHANVADTAKEDLARAIARECMGLPIAIVAVGTCLKGKGIDQMKVMLYRLRNAKPINVDKGVRDAFACLELSYDYLATPEAKQLLLMCTMFPEDHSISVEALFRYGVGLGLCNDVDSFEAARSQVRTTIDDLIDSSLLMRSAKFKTSAKEYVTMHDVVRDFALWKAYQEDRTIIAICTKELNELIANEALKDCYAVSSWYDNNESPQFPSQLNAQKLEFLLLRSRKPLDLSQATFEGTKRLKALIIEYIDQLRIEVQPQSFKYLSNLRTLRLQNWDLRDISFVVSLTILEILDLCGSKFERVPNGIENLSKLKLLDFSSCRIDECYFKVVGRCSQLEELYVSPYFPHSKHTNCYEYPVGPTALMKLRRFKLKIGEHERGLVFVKSTRSLCLSQINISMICAIVKDLAQRATTIEFYELEGGNKNFMPNIVQAIGGMHELTKLCLEKCLEIECIMDETTHEDAIVPRLDELVLRDMDNLKQLCSGPSPSNLFQKLERLIIFNCPQLLHIFPADCNLGNLKFLHISNCPMLTSLFPISAACTMLSLEELRIERCSELKHAFEGDGGADAWEKLRFPKLKVLFVDDCCKLKTLCPVFLSQSFAHEGTIVPSLDELKLRDIDNFKQLRHGPSPSILFQNLERLIIFSCPQLLLILPAHCNFGNLKFLHISSSPMLTSLFHISTACTLLSLEALRIEHCNELKHVLEGEGDAWENLRFPKLKNLLVHDCCKLESICPVFLAQSLVQLKRLSIINAPQMKFVFGENAGEEQAMRDEDEPQTVVLPLLEYLNLKNLSNLVGICPKRYCIKTTE